MPTDWGLRPADNELEITLLGRGFGESVVLHLCDNDWVVIDSHLDKNRRSAPCEYLQSIDIPADHVKLILATHFHDDHIAGIGELYKWAVGAQLVISLPKNAKEFHSYIQANGAGGFDDISSGIDEFVSLINTRHAENRATPIQCQANVTLFRKHSAAINKEVALTALSPSPKDVEEFIILLGSAILDQEGAARRLSTFDPNDISVAAWLSVGDEAVLLGADLEVQADEERGWKAVLASKGRPLGKAGIFKVAHHGSSNGDHPEIWSELLTLDPISILTPFNKGVGVPKRADKDRILSKSTQAYITNPTPFRKFRDGSPMVRSALDASGIQIRAGNAEVGRITLRRRLGEESWRISPQNGADHLRNFVPRD